MRGLLSRQYRRIRETISFYRHETTLPGFTPRGHFYSPLPAINSAATSIAPVDDALPGIDLRADSQHAVLQKILAMRPEFDWT